MRVTNFGATWYRPDVIVGEPRIRCVLNAHPVRILVLVKVTVIRRCGQGRVNKELRSSLIVLKRRSLGGSIGKRESKDRKERK
jgi:hypothetical protein